MNDYEQNWKQAYRPWPHQQQPETPDIVVAILTLATAMNRLATGVEAYILASKDPPGHQAPGSVELNLPDDNDGFSAALPKR